MGRATHAQVELAQEDLEALAQRTADFAGSDVFQLCQEAAQTAVLFGLQISFM